MDKVNGAKAKLPLAKSIVFKIVLRSVSLINERFPATSARYGHLRYQERDHAVSGDKYIKMTTILRWTDASGELLNVVAGVAAAFLSSTSGAVLAQQWRLVLAGRKTCVAAGELLSAIVYRRVSTMRRWRRGRCTRLAGRSP